MCAKTLVNKKDNYVQGFHQLVQKMYGMCWSHYKTYDHLWRTSSKPVVCGFLDIELEDQVGERGFRVYNSSIQLVFVNLP